MTTPRTAAVAGTLDRLRTAWAARSPREHAMLIAAAAALGWALADGLAWQPASAGRTQLTQRIAALTAERDALAAHSAQWAEAQRAHDAQEATWRERLQRAEARGAELRAGVTPPAEMLSRLRTLSGQGSRVRLVALAAQPGQPLDGAAGASPTAPPSPPATSIAPGATPVAAAGAGSPIAVVGVAAPGPARVLYRLPVEVTVEGPWPALHEYLQQLEAQAPGLRWQTLHLDAGRWPATRLTLRAETLSEQGRWSLQ